MFASQRLPEEDPLIVKDLANGSSVTIGLAPGATVQLPFSHDLIGLALAEVLQERGQIEDAVAVVEQVTPTARAAVSLAELYSEAGRLDDVIELTNDFLRVARVLRVVRLLRLVRAGGTLWRVSVNLRGVLNTNGLAGVLGFSSVLIAVGGLAMWAVEPRIGSIADAI